MKEKDIELAEVFKALSHPVRLEILRYLNKGPSCATLTNNAIPISQPNLSQHLKILKDAGLVDCGKAGTKRCFYICRPSIVSSVLELSARRHPKLIREGSDLVGEIQSVRRSELKTKCAKG